MTHQALNKCLVLVPNVLFNGRALEIGRFTLLPSANIGDLPAADQALLGAINTGLAHELRRCIDPFLFALADCLRDEADSVNREAIRAMSILRYAICESNSGLGLQLNYYVWPSIIEDPDTYEGQQFFLRGWRNGFVPSSFFAPGVRKRDVFNLRPLEINSVGKISLLEAFSAGNVSDSLLRAIDRANAAKLSHFAGDQVSAIWNMTAALESLYREDTEASQNLTNSRIKEWLSTAFGSEEIGKWGEQFYRTRSNLIHSQLADFPTDDFSMRAVKKFFFAYKHPRASTETEIAHLSIAEVVVQALIDIQLDMRTRRGGMVRAGIWRLASKDRIEQMLTPNEVVFKEFTALLGQGLKWRSRAFEIQARKITQGNDGSVLGVEGHRALKSFLASISRTAVELRPDCSEIKRALGGMDPFQAYLPMSRLGVKLAESGQPHWFCDILQGFEFAVLNEGLK